MGGRAEFGEVWYTGDDDGNAKGTLLVESMYLHSHCHQAVLWAYLITNCGSVRLQNGHVGR